MRIGPVAGGGVCATMPQTANAASARTLRTRRIRTLGHVDDLPVRQAVRRAQSLTVAGRGLTSHLVRLNLLPLLDDDLALSLRIRLDHRHFTLRIDEIAHAIDGKEREHEADDE